MAYSTSVRTVLKNVNKDKLGTIFLEIVFIDDETKKKVRRYSNTKQRVHSDDVVKSKLKSTDRTKLIRQIIEKKIVETNDKLRELTLINNGNLTPEIYDQSIVANVHARKTVFELYDDFIKYIEDNFEPRTWQKHKTVKSFLEEFAGNTGYKKIYPNDITVKFYKDFSSFLRKTKKHAPQTVNKYQGCLKTFMRYLTTDMGLNQSEIHKNFKKDSKRREGGSKIVLMKEHVQKLVDWKPTNERYELVRDLFMFQIYTGIRYSDLININKSQVLNNSLNFTMWKVEKDVTIPLHPKALEILKKYNYALGEKCKSLQNYNLDIKTVCKLAGLTDKIKSLNIKLSRKVSDDTEMYKLVSTHVARVTFITNCLIAGITPFIVMEYTGHEKIDTLSVYMRIAGNMAKDAFAKYENYFDF